MQDKWKMIFLLSLLVMVTIWLAVILFPKQNYKVIACDVGQGDAILITYGSTQILSDGGPDSSVLECLSDNMAFWDRKIELVIISHPQLDHFGGIIDVMGRFDVESLMISGLDASSQEYGVLKSLVGGSDTRVIKVSSGQKYRLGLIYLDILWPSEMFISANSEENNDAETSVLGAFVSGDDANAFSLVTMVGYEDFEILLTGDITPEVSNVLAEKIEKDSRYDEIEILKVPHHGSKNGLTEKLLDTVGPEMAIISVGENNRYGHPNNEIIDMLNKRKIEILRTDEIGDIELTVNNTD